MGIWRSPVGIGDLIAQVEGEGSVVDLPMAEAVNVLIDHSADVEFAQVPMVSVTVPAGIRVSVLASDEAQHSTDGGQFVLRFENVSYNADLGQGGADPDFAYSWVRRGLVSTEGS